MMADTLSGKTDTMPAYTDTQQRVVVNITNKHQDRMNAHFDWALGRNKCGIVAKT